MTTPEQRFWQSLSPASLRKVSGSMFFSLVSVIVYYHCQSHPCMFSQWINRYVFNACIDLINHEQQSFTSSQFMFI